MKTKSGYDSVGNFYVHDDEENFLSDQWDNQVSVCLLDGFHSVDSSYGIFTVFDQEVTFRKGDIRVTVSFHDGMDPSPKGELMPKEIAAIKDRIKIIKNLVFDELSKSQQTIDWD